MNLAAIRRDLLACSILPKWQDQPHEPWPGIPLTQGPR